MTSQKLKILRFASHGLLEQFDSPLDVLKNSVGIQGQAQKMAEINVGLRTKNLTLAQLQSYYTDYNIIRSWGQRWTLHLFTVDDWNLIINARQNERLPKNYFMGQNELVNAVVEEIKTVLPQQKIISRDNFNLMLNDLGAQSDITYPILQLLVSQGIGFIDAGSSPQHFNIVTADNTFTKMEISTAIKKLILKFLRGFAPATIEDFVKWSGIKMGTVRPIWNRLKPNMVTFEDEGQTYFLADDALLKKAQVSTDVFSNNVFITSRFDSLLTGYADKEWLVPKEHQSKMWSKNGILMAPIIVDGNLVGRWNYQIKAKKINFELQLWEKINKVNQQKLEQQLQKVGGFLGLEPGNLTTTSLIH